MFEITTESLAALLADAYSKGHEDGHMLIPSPSPETLFLNYQEQVESMCEVRH